MTPSRQKRLDLAQMRVLFQVPFFAPGVVRLPVVLVPEVEFTARFCEEGQKATACTDGETIYWCAEWFDSLPDQVLVTLLCHEVCHCMLGHLWRIPSGGDEMVWNEACDHAVNLMIKDFGAQVMARRLADPFPFPQDAPGLADPQYANLAEETIYSKLMSRPPNKSGGRKSGKGGGNGAGKTGPSFGQFKGKPGQNTAAQKSARVGWEGTLLQSVAAMKGRGELPSCLDRLVEGLVSPSVDWWNVLRSWLREQSADDWDFLTPCLEYSDGPFILPSLKSEKMGAVVFATDTSGSIDPEMLAKFQSEKQECLDSMRPRSLVDIYCDAKVHKVAEYSVGDVITKECPGGGGTSFVPVWKELAKRHITPKCLVYLTDLDGDFGADPGYPVLWVTWTKGAEVPFGQVIYAGK